MRRPFRAALSHNRTFASDCRKLASTRTSWAIKAKAIASVFATRAPQLDSTSARCRSVARAVAIFPRKVGTLEA